MATPAAFDPRPVLAGLPNLPGVYRMFDPLDRIEVRSFNIASPEYAGHDVDALVARLGERLGETFVLANIGTDEVGLV